MWSNCCCVCLCMCGDVSAAASASSRLPPFHLCFVIVNELPGFEPFSIMVNPLQLPPAPECCHTLQAANGVPAALQSEQLLPAVGLSMMMQEWQPMPPAGCLPATLSSSASLTSCTCTCPDLPPTACWTLALALEPPSGLLERYTPCPRKHEQPVMTLDKSPVMAPQCLCWHSSCILPGVLGLSASAPLQCQQFLAGLLA